MRVRIIALRPDQNGEELIDITEADHARDAWRLLSGLLRFKNGGDFRLIVERIAENCITLGRSDAFITLGRAEA